MGLVEEVFGFWLLLSALELRSEGGGGWMSMLQPLLVSSTSKPSLSTRILPHESQFGGTRTLSLSMTLCFRACFLSREWMPRVEWMRVGSEFGADVDVYIKEAPSALVSCV